MSKIRSMIMFPCILHKALPKMLLAVINKQDEYDENLLDLLLQDSFSISYVFYNPEGMLKNCRRKFDIKED